MTEETKANLNPAAEICTATTPGGRLGWCARSGAKAGLRTSVWLAMIMVPVSLAVTLLHWSGALGYVAKWLTPLFDLLGLPAETILACLVAGSLSIYSGIAALGSIPLTDRQVTIVAMIMLISHNILVESAVQHKAGTNVFRIAMLRIAYSLAAAFLLNCILPPGDPTPHTRGGVVNQAFWPMMLAWAGDIAKLMAQVMMYVTSLTVLQRILKEFRLIDKLAWLLTPLLWLLGLPRRMAFLWIVANTLGLAYGAGVILEEVRTGALNKEDAQILNRSVGICHSLLEDTLLFMAIGAWAFWITVPRLALAALAVWTYRAGRFIVRRYCSAARQ